MITELNEVSTDHNLVIIKFWHRFMGEIWSYTRPLLLSKLYGPGSSSAKLQCHQNGNQASNTKPGLADELHLCGSLEKKNSLHVVVAEIGKAAIKKFKNIYWLSSCKNLIE